MLEQFRKLVFGSKEESNSSPKNRIELATCVVLVEAARADDDFTDVERRYIVDVLVSRFDLTQSEAQELIKEAVAVREASPDLWHFTHQLNEEFSREDKMLVMEEAWRLFYSDGILEGHEDHLAHKLRDLLNLSQRELIGAKMKVLKEVRGE